MHVGPPDPLIPTSVAGYVWTSHPAAVRAAAVSRIALGDDDDAGPNSQHVAAQRRELRVGHLDEADPRARPRSCHSPTGRSGRYTTARSSATGEMTLIRWMSSAGPFQYGTSKMRTSPPTSLASWSAPSWFVRRVRPMQKRSGRSQTVSPPSIVPGASIRPTSGIPAAVVQASRIVGLARAIRLARSQRDRAALRHEQRVERVDEVRVAGRLVLEDVDGRAQTRQHVHEGIVLTLGDRTGRPATGTRVRDRRTPDRTPARAASRGPRGAGSSCSARRSVGCRSSRDGG